MARKSKYGSFAAALGATPKQQRHVRTPPPPPSVLGAPSAAAFGATPSQQAAAGSSHPVGHPYQPATQPQSALIAGINNLLTPNAPSVRQIAEVADRLGVKPLEESDSHPLGKNAEIKPLASAVGSLLSHVVTGPTPELPSLKHPLGTVPPVPGTGQPKVPGAGPTPTFDPVKKAQKQLAQIRKELGGTLTPQEEKKILADLTHTAGEFGPANTPTAPKQPTGLTAAQNHGVAPAVVQKAALAAGKFAFTGDASDLSTYNKQAADAFGQQTGKALWEFDPLTGKYLGGHVPTQKGAQEWQQAQRGEVPTAPRKPNPKDPLGAKTIGNATAAELAKAGAEGRLKLTGKGKILTPNVRRAILVLKNARAAYKKGGSGHDNSVEGRVGAYLRSHGLNRVGAAGILGNAFAESSFQPGAEGYGGGGLWGFTSGEVSLASVQKYAASKGKNWEDPIVQTEFLLQHVDPSTISAVNSAGTPEKAAALFMEQFEKPEVYNYADREAAGRSAFGSKAWGSPDPKSAARLHEAVAHATALGINVPVPGAEQKGNVTYVPQTAKSVLGWAIGALGVTTGSKREVHIAELVGGVTDPWCAVFVSRALQGVGIEPPANPNYSGAFLEPSWKGGKNLHTTDLSKAKPGDILVFDWGDGGITDHVAIYKGGGQMIGGNQGQGEVSLEEVPTESIVGISRPTYSGKKVPVSNEPVPPGASTGTSGGGGTGTETGSGAGGAGGPTGGGVAAPLAPLAQIPLNELLQVLRLNPLGESESEGEGGGAGQSDIIARILSRKRL